MRELSLEEQELIAGGTDTTDVPEIVVTADPGDGGGGGDWGDSGDWGDGGGTPGDSGGGGGGGDPTETTTTTTDNNGEIVVIGARYDEAQRSADIVAQVKNAVGYMEIVWDIAKMDVQSLKLNIKDGTNSYTGSVNLGNGMTTGTYDVTFSNGITGTFSLGGNGSDFSLSAGIKVTM